MREDEKLQLMIDYLCLDVNLMRTILLKQDAVKSQDFKAALIHRESEVELRRQYAEVGDKLLNLQQNVQESDTTEAQ